MFTSVKTSRMSERDSRILIASSAVEAESREAVIFCDRDSHHPHEDLVLDHKNGRLFAFHCLSELRRSGRGQPLLKG